MRVECAVLDGETTKQGPVHSLEATRTGTEQMKCAADAIIY